MTREKPSTCYLETYFEVVAEMEKRSDTLYELLPGTGGKWEFAEKLTDLFESTHKDNDWIEDDYFDTLELFLHEQLKDYPKNTDS